MQRMLFKEKRKYTLVIITIVILITAYPLLLVIDTVSASTEKFAILVTNEKELLVATPIAVNLKIPILYRGKNSIQTFLKYYGSYKVISIRESSIFSYSLKLIKKFNIKAKEAVLTSSKNQTVLILASLYATNKGIPLLVYDTEKEVVTNTKELPHGIITISASNTLINYLKKRGFIVQAIPTSKIIEIYNSEVNSKVLSLGLTNDPLSTLIPYYAVFRKSYVILCSKKDLSYGKMITSFIKHYNIKYLTVFVSFKNLKYRGKLEEGNLVNLIYKIVMDSYKDKYLKVAIGFISGINLEDALSFLMRNLYYNELIGEWRNNFLALYMTEGMALAKKIIRIAKKVNLRVYEASLSENQYDRYDIAVNLLKKGGLITYINLHGNPLGMSSSPFRGWVLTGIALSAPIPYITPTIVITFSCETAGFQAKYLVNPAESIALSFINRGAVAYIGAMTLEYSSGIEIDTAHAELIMTMLLQGYNIGEIIRIINNLHISSNSRIRPYLAAYTVLLGDPLFHLKPLLKEKLCQVIAIKENEKYEIKVLRNTPVFYAYIELPVSADRIKKVEIIGRNVVSWSYVERAGTSMCKVFVFATKELSLEAGDFMPGDTIKVNIIYKVPLWQFIMIIVTIVLSFVILGYILARKGRKTK